MAANKEQQYTDPQLRERLKSELTAGDKGGRPGQWSARKAQLLAREYAKAGGGYRTDKAQEAPAAAHLDEWTAEEWQTRDGSTSARDGDETARYLPKDAWERLSAEEASQADRTKRAASRAGKQFVANPAAAREAGREIRDRPDAEPWPGYDELTVPEVRTQLQDGDDALAAHVAAYEKAHKGRAGVLRAAAP